MKKTMPLITVFLLLISCSIALAELKTFVKEYTYQASEDDSRNSSQTLALRQVKRLLLEELGTYLESETEVKNFQLTKDQITTLTAGIVRTEIVEEKWDGRTYWLKAKIAADSGEVIKSIDVLRKDRVKTRELEDLRRRSDKLIKENERLRKELTVAKATKREKYKIEYNKTIKELMAIEWFEKGNVSFFSGHYNDAADSYGKAMELHPKPNPYIYHLRGIAYYKLGNIEHAILDFNRSIGLNPKDTDTYNSRGLAYYKLGNPNKAMQDFNKAIKLNPGEAMTYNNRGLQYHELGKYRQAVQDFNRAIKIDPKDATAYLNRGGSYYRLGKYNQAINDFDKVIKIYPSHAAAYYNRGVIHSKLGNYRRAIQDYQRAIEIDPENAKAYYNRGLAYNKLGNVDQAIRDMKTAAQLGDKAVQDSLREQGIDW